MTQAHSPSTPKKSAAFAVSRRHMLGILAGMVVLGTCGGIWYWIDNGRFVFTDKAEVSAPLINLGPQSTGILKNVLVRDGDTVTSHKTVARVGDEMIQSEIGGIVIMAKQDIGAAYRSGDTVVTMIDPSTLRIVARVQEDKGLKDIFAGQKVQFTVDAFGSKKYDGEVEAVIQSKRSGDVVFNISDKREEKEFEVKIRFDREQYPELQNGMSARVWIVK